MSWRLPELAIALGLAAMFFCAGELLLKRRSRTALEANQSFLVGAAFAAALLFPATLLFARAALPAIAILLCLSALGWMVARWRLLRPRSEQKPRPSLGAVRRDWAFALLALPIFMLVAAFALLNLRLSLSWDGFQIWTSKAMVLYHEGALTPVLWPTVGVAEHFVDYPPLIPLYEALLALISGEFVFVAVKPVFLVFYGSLLLSTYHAASCVVAKKAALLATLLTGMLPMLCGGSSIGGYADMPLACFVAAVLAASWLSETGASPALPWLAGGLLMVKNEGAVLLAAAVLVEVLGDLGQGRALAARRYLKNYRSIAILAGFVAIRCWYAVWAQGTTGDFAGVRVESFSRAWERLAGVLADCARVMFSVRTWGVFWITFLVAVVVVLVLGSPRSKRLALAVVVAIGAEEAIYLFTNWSPKVHIESSFGRLLSQLTPAAAVLMVYAHRALFSSTGLRHSARRLRGKAEQHVSGGI